MKKISPAQEHAILLCARCTNDTSGSGELMSSVPASFSLQAQTDRRSVRRAEHRARPGPRQARIARAAPLPASPRSADAETRQIVSTRHGQRLSLIAGLTEFADAGLMARERRPVDCPAGLAGWAIIVHFAAARVRAGRARAAAGSQCECQDRGAYGHRLFPSWASSYRTNWSPSVVTVRFTPLRRAHSCSTSP